MPRVTRTDVRRGRYALALLVALASGVLLSGCALQGSRVPGGLAVEFEGLETYSRSSAIGALDFDSFEPDRARTGGRTAALKAFADDAAFDLESFYRGRGFADANVTFRLEPERDPPLVVLVVEEGVRTHLEDIVFEGNTAFDNDTLAALATVPTVGAFGQGRRLFVRQGLVDLRRAVRDAYVANGFLDVEVEGPEFTFTEDREGAWAAYSVLEGAQYQVESIEFLGGELVVGELDALRAAYVGRPFFPRLPFEVRGRVFEVLENAGYAEAEIDLESELDTVGASVALALRIATGPRIVIGDVRFEGTETGERFLRSRLALRPGQVYDGRKVQETFRKLHETGLFTRVGIDAKRLDGDPDPEDELGPEAELGPEEVAGPALEVPAEGEAESEAGLPAEQEPPSGGDQVRDLVVTLEDAPSLETFVEPGWGSWELARIRAGIEEKNFRGTGLRLRAEGKYAVRNRSVLLGLTDPWLFETSLVGDLILRAEKAERPAFTKQELSASAIVTKNWSRALLSRVGYEYKRSDARDVIAVDDEVIETQNDVDISSIQFSQRLDRRDNVLAPNRGLYLNGSLEWSAKVLGSDLDFLRPQVSLREFRQLREGTVLAGHFNTGLIAPLGSTELIPVQERYFNGGATSVRSFREDQLGPKDTAGNPLGGETFTVLSAELRQRLWGSLQAAAFADAGNVTLTTGEYFKFPDFRFGLGVGLRFLLPIGPLRLDAAVNPAPRSGEDHWVVHFSIGMPF